MAAMYYIGPMKTCSIRLPDRLVAEIEAESRARRISKSDVIRERLERVPAQATDDPLASIRDLIGSVDGGPADLSARKKHYLRAWGYGRRHPR
jgi:Arc/MetJ-type ribon-helix-helix transcriptional regulator